jgi:hypothetical protein
MTLALQWNEMHVQSRRLLTDKAGFSAEVAAMD